MSIECDISDIRAPEERNVYSLAIVGFPVVARFIGRWCAAMNRRATSYSES